MKRLGNIFKNVSDEVVEDEWKVKARQKRAFLIKQHAAVAKDYAKGSYNTKIKLYPKLIDLSNQIRNIDNRLETI